MVKKMTKRVFKIAIKIFVSTMFLIFVLTIVGGCSTGSKQEPSDKQSTTVEETDNTTTKEADYEEEVVDILNSTSYIDSIDPSYVQYGLCSDITFGQLIQSMFENPKLDITPLRSRGSNDIYGYSVTIPGKYRNTLDGDYINEGNAYISIGLNTNSCSLTGDHYFKSAAEYYALELAGYY